MSLVLMAAEVWVETHGCPKREFGWHTLANIDIPEKALDSSLGITEELLCPQADEWEPREYDAMKRSRSRGALRFPI
jgi:hypothetical protein